MLAVIDGPLPDVPIGLHCSEPRGCAFLDRCWPKDAWHISNLYNVGPKRADAFMKRGVHSIRDLSERDKKNFTVRRQVKSMETGQRIVEAGLRSALQGLDVEPLGFLDFETIARAVPVWPAMSPWQMAAAQFSYHESQPGGEYRHVEHLAEGPRDARPLIAAKLVEATRHAAKVVTYSSFEKTQIRALMREVPEFATELAALGGKLVDLLPIVRDHVYDPQFRGSFSLKCVLPALVPELSYSDLVIVDGRVASVEIARLLFVADRIPVEERERVRKDLLAYCERDTWAMVRLVEELRDMA
jgi:predicted RecB family nuclease